MERARASARIILGSRGIGFYFIALILLAVVPLLVIAGVLIARQGALQREAFNRSLLQTSFALSVAVDRQLDAYRIMLETLAEAEELRHDRISDFQQISSRVAETHGALFISLFDREGTQIFNTLRPPGSALPTPFNDPRTTAAGDSPPIGDPSALQRVLETAKPANSDLLYGLIAQRLLFTVNIPVIRDGKVAYVLTAGFTPDVMSRMLTQNPQFSGVPAVIYDRRGFTVGRWRDADKFVGARTNSWNSEDVRRGHSGVTEGTTRDGVSVYYSYTRSPITGWGVNVGAERVALDRDIRRSWVIGGVLALGGVGLGLLLAMSLASRLKKAVVELAEAASLNQPPARKGLRTREIVQLETALDEATRARESEAQEREKRLVAETREAEAEESNRMKDQFIALMSHELRNPLAPIRSSVQILRTMGPNADTASFGRVVDILDRQSRHLTHLVNDLLDLSRIRSGKMDLRKERVDLRSVVRQAAETAGPGIESHRHDLVIKLPEHPLEVIGDSDRLSQIVVNLLDNAVKFTPPGGTIEVFAGVDGTNAQLTVKDNGIGIEPSMIPELFTPFAQGNSTERGNGGGLGLGLTLARSLAELHGGTIDAYSDGSNRGSTFTLRLPLCSSPSADTRSDSVASAPTTPKASRRILVVDDNVDAAHVLSISLQALGFQTCMTHDGLSALQLTAEFLPDVVLLDIGLPGLDGYAVAKRLRVQEEGRALLIVAITGWGQDADREKSREAGIDLHFVKPIEIDDLVQALAFKTETVGT